MWRLKPKIDLSKLGNMKTGEMNETEKAYAWILDARKHKGEILHYEYEAHKLRLADGCWYIVDFMVYTAPDGVMEIHEVKGPFVREDSIIKLKGIAEKYPFPVFLCQNKKRNTTQFEISRIGR